MTELYAPSLPRRHFEAYFASDKTTFLFSEFPFSRALYQETYCRRVSSVGDLFKMKLAFIKDFTLSHRELRGIGNGMARYLIKVRVQGSYFIFQILGIGF